MADEFSLINRWFAPLSSTIGDDCAVLQPVPDTDLAISIDTQVESVHFPVGGPPDQIAWRATAAALSDLAAMGAVPLGVTLGLTLPEADDAWLERFADGLGRCLREHDCDLLGGDTTRGPLTVTVQVLGELPRGRALYRSGASVGDEVFVSGYTGDAAAALAYMAGTWPGSAEYGDHLLQCYYQPRARLALGRQLLDVASSAIDISDGLLADASHVCERSGVGMEIDVLALPLSDALRSVPRREQALDWALGGGDDYQLLFTVNPQRIEAVPAGCHAIGRVVSGSGVRCEHVPTQPGYAHFQQSANA